MLQCESMLTSDWSFIMKTQSHVEYAVRRIKDHLLGFTRLYEEIKENRVDENHLRGLESRNTLFPDIDYRVYASS